MSLFGVSLVSFTASAPGQNGSFTGDMAGVYTGPSQPLAPGPSQFIVINNDSIYTVDDLTSAYAHSPLAQQPGNELQPGETVGGLTEKGNPFVNLTAVDISSVPGSIPDDAYNDLQTQIYELGNSLGFITETAPQTFHVSLGAENNEPGKNLLNCYNGIVRK